MRLLTLLAIFLLICGCMESEQPYSDEAVSFNCPGGWSIIKDTKTIEGLTANSINCMQGPDAQFLVMWMDVGYYVNDVDQKMLEEFYNNIRDSFLKEFSQLVGGLGYEPYVFRPISSEFRGRPARKYQIQLNHPTGNDFSGEIYIFTCKDKFIFTSISKSSEIDEEGSRGLRKCVNSFKCN